LVFTAEIAENAESAGDWSMGWRERLVKARFRGIPFFVDTHNLSTGRRVAVHEFPGGSAALAEDLGLQAREFTLEAFVLGPDYDAARDKLLEALRKPGPGKLVHPYLGALRAQVGRAALRESSAEGGLARFTITFHEVGAPLAAAIRVTPLVQLAARRSIAESIRAFGRKWNVLGMISDYVDGLKTDLGEILAATESAVAGVTNAAANLIRAPFDLGASIAGSLGRLQALGHTPLGAFALYEKNFRVEAKQKNPPTGTLNEQRRADNQAALVALVRQVSLAEGAVAAAAALEGATAPPAGTAKGAIDGLAEEGAVSRGVAELAAPGAPAAPAGGGAVESAAQAAELRDRLLEGIDAALESAPEGVYQALSDARGALVRAYLELGARLPRVERWTPPATLPAVVLAYRLYGDPAREGELARRNRIRHPGFVPGGQALEVLRG
jgi:prophage DNA circulation protein